MLPRACASYLPPKAPKNQEGSCMSTQGESKRKCDYSTGIGAIDMRAERTFTCAHLDCCVCACRDGVYGTRALAD